MKMVSVKVSHQEKFGFKPITYTAMGWNYFWVLKLYSYFYTQIFSRDAHLERHMALGHFVSVSCLELGMQNANFGYVTT